ncbi:MAG: acetyl-CoA hydrolase/transferase family protein [Deltaproteobacteria bacterium]|nr:acetyl-CoA hydrolase/transferase family protein [Deltaproteobacteria bacterium]
MKGSKKHRNVSPEEAIGHISPGRRLVLPTEIVSGLQVAYPFLAEGLEASFTFRTWQCAPPIRHLLKKGTVRYIPMRQGDAVRVFSKKGPWPVDVALIQVSPPDEHGFCSLGVSIGHMLPLSLEAELVIAEVNPRMPRVLGDSFIHLSRIDYVVESDRELLEYPSGGKPGEKEISIGRHAAELIPDGATLQIGIGAIPEAILDGLSEKRDLRFFAMGVDKIVDMVEKGVVVPGPGPKIRVTEILGSRRLRPLPETINPQVVGRIPRFCSVVSAIELDLTGQVNAETVKGMQISAIGGSFDFIQGALFSEGGCSILALTSTTPDEKISRIVPQLAPGTAVTTPRHSVQYVVTEYGIAEIWGRSLKERALALAQIAHPKFRDDLLEKAKELF